MRAVSDFNKRSEATICLSRRQLFLRSVVKTGAASTVLQRYQNYLRERVAWFGVSLAPGCVRMTRETKPLAAILRKLPSMT